ncbi:hypothetical protein BH11MYX3_BH11MYX3_32820 [soil metagenome]
MITTAAGARVVILLAHNNATWDLGPNKHEQVSQSMAWQLARVDAPAGQVDETTTAAGRHAERSAANGESAAAERSRGAPMAPPAEQAPAPTAPAEPPPTAQPPPPPPPKTAVSAPPKTVRSKSAPPRAAGSIDGLGAGGGAPGGSSGTGATSTRRAPMDKGDSKESEATNDAVSDKASRNETMAVDGTSVVNAAVDKERAALRSCVVASGKDTLALVFHVDKGKTSIDLAGGSDADRACLAKVAARIKLTVDAPTTYSIVISK